MKRFNHISGAACRVCLLVVMALFAGIPGNGTARAGDEPIKIGVLAVRGSQQCLESWSPTADYLTREMPGRRFVIVPLAHDRIYPSVKDGDVDFILANSAFYVGLEHWYKVNRILTLKERRLNGVYTRYGGVIFCRRDRQDIKTLKDLRGKSFMAVSESSLGGWLMAWREFKEMGIDPYRDFKRLRFNETHDQVVYAVRDRQVDAGTVRTNTLEVLTAEGKIDLSDYRVFPRIHETDLKTPYLCTTREYPDWPLAKVRHTPEVLAEDVAVALLQMPPDAPEARAAGCAGWTIPLNYQPVHDCLKALKVGPYENLGKITVMDVLHTYWPWILSAVAAFCVLAGFTGVVLKLNRRIETSNVLLKEEINLRQQKDLELQQARDMAETATRAKSEFLANMSHEIRTPMNGVIAATDLALGEDVPPNVERYLQIIQSSAYSLLGIINDILDFSKIEAGKFELKERIFRLNEVFDRVMELFINKAAEKGIELLVDIEQDTPRVIMGDPLRLQQILTNLISNAIKFTDSGGVVLVHVKALAEPEAGSDPGTVVFAFSVKDTGTGIAPEYLGLLFDPFSQADTSSTRKYEGTGLGLSICKQLVTMMGGDIGVETEVGKGSTFSFTVRLGQPAARPASRLVLPPDIKGLNVLVVDDLADSRTIMGKMLESLGFRVETVDSGIDALARLDAEQMRRSPVELVMMDWKMPSMDGLEASKKIRQDLKLAIPIIMMTAFGREEQRIDAEKMGINGFLTKPIYPSTLFDAIMDAFGKGGARENGRANHFTTRASIYKKHLKGIRILVAEDNPTNQQVAQAILEGAGIDVTIVSNGVAAVEAVQTRAFDAVLMDIQMPRMNGFDATRSIRALPLGSSLPIVAMTAHAMKGDEEKCLEAGMDGYISKPVNQDRLFHTLWRLLRTRSSLMESAGKDPGITGTGTTGTGITGTGGQERESAGNESQGPRPTVRGETSLPARVPGINIQETLTALAIDPSTLARILAGFLADNQDTARKLTQASASGDTEGLLQMAHSLKGSAANIGAGDLSTAAHRLEKACRETLPGELDSTLLKGLMTDVEAALVQVLASIQALEKPVPAEGSVLRNGDAPAAEPIDRDLAGLLQTLADAIDRADPEQIQNLLPEIRAAAHWKTHDPVSIRILDDQLRRYDYDQALETIHRITSQ